MPRRLAGVAEAAPVSVPVLVPVRASPVPSVVRGSLVVSEEATGQKRMS